MLDKVQLAFASFIPGSSIKTSFCYLIISKLVYFYRKDVVGRARGFLPYVGIVTIIMNEYPKFKYAVLACLGFYVLIHRE
jgi:hypothetical protein